MESTLPKWDPDRWSGFAELRDALQKDLAGLISRELGLWRLKGPFILLESETGVDLGGCWGMYSPALAALYPEHIPETGANGPTWIVADSTMMAAYGDFGHCVKDFVGICCHELAHALEYPGLCLPLDESIQGGKPCLEEQMAEQPGEARDIKQRPHHQPGFIRLVLHVQHRMQKLGWSTWMRNLVNWERDAHCSPFEHYDALRQELIQSERLSFGTVRRRRPPEEFINLFPDWEPTRK